MAKRVLAALLGLLLAAPAAAAPMSFVFSQTGFTGGGTVTGSFTADDTDMDGQLTLFSADEILAFSMSFSGGGGVPAFTLGLDDLIGFVYDNDGGPLGDDASEGIDVSDLSTFAWLVGAAVTTEPSCGSVVGCIIYTPDSETEIVLTTSGSVTVEAVPVPGAFILFASALALGGLGVAASRRRPARCR